MRFRLFPTAVLALVAVGAVAAPSGAAAALKPGDGYVALGSSFASGPLIPEVADQSCLRSTNNYPNLVARKLKLTLTDVSCGASTTDNVITTPQGVHPLQLDAVTPDTKLVTVTTGGNDISYTATNLICAAAGAQGRGCLGTEVDPNGIETALAALPAKMAAMLEAIKAKAPDAHIVVLPYPRVLPPSGTPCPPSVPMQPADLKFMNEISDKMHAVIKESAAKAKVDYVESYTQKGHDACAPPAKRWIEGQEPASTALAFHPNENAMQAQAKLILAKLAAKKK